MKSHQQKITAPRFTVKNEVLSTSGVIVANLNTHPIDKYLLINGEKHQGLIMVKFEDVVVAGDVKGHKSNQPSLISDLSKSVVPRSSLIPIEISGNVEFRNELLIQKLRTASINALPTDSFIHKNHQTVLIEAPANVKNLIVTNLIVDRELLINSYNNVELPKLSLNAFKITQQGIKIESIILSDFKAVNMTVDRFEGQSFDKMLSRFQQEFSTNQPRTLSINGNLTIIRNVFVERLNEEIILNEFFNSLAMSVEGDILSIGGQKTFEADIKAHDLIAYQLNGRSTKRLLHRSLSRGDKQTLHENLFIKNLVVGSLHTNSLNDIHWKSFVSKKKLDRPLLVNLHLDELIVNDLMTNFASFDLNLLIQSVKFPKRSNWNYVDVENETFAVLDEFSPLNQLLAFAVDKFSPKDIFGNVVIDTPKFYMKNVLKSSMEISTRTTVVNLNQLFQDSVKNYQPHPEVIFGKKTISVGNRFDAGNLSIDKKCSFYSTLVNGINITELNQSFYRGSTPESHLYAKKSFGKIYADEFVIEGDFVNGIKIKEIVTSHSKLAAISFANLVVSFNFLVGFGFFEKK